MLLYHNSRRIYYEQLNFNKSDKIIRSNPLRIWYKYYYYPGINLKLLPAPVSTFQLENSIFLCPGNYDINPL